MLEYQLSPCRELTRYFRIIMEIAHQVILCELVSIADSYNFQGLLVENFEQELAAFFIL